MTVDHVLPVALGGSDDPTNLVAACVDCNAGKTSTGPGEHLVAQVSDDAVRWAKAQRAAAAEMAAESEAAAEYLDAFRRTWGTWGRNHRPIELPVIWRSAVTGWHRAGLPLVMLEESVEIAMRRNLGDEALFPYLCGIVRNKLAAITKRASEIAATEAPSSAPKGRCGHCFSCTDGSADECYLSHEFCSGDPELECDCEECPHCGNKGCLWWLDRDSDMTTARNEGFRAGEGAGEQLAAKYWFDRITPSILVEAVIDGELHRIPDRFKLADKAA